MSKIQKVDQQPNFPVLEQKINEFWKQNDIFKKSVEQRSADNSYSFVDGPPFPTGTPHYGSLLPSIAKDVIPRYWTMKGKRVRRVWGWDAHGLTVEGKVNTKLGIKSSKQLEEEFGIERYIQECRDYISDVTADWKTYIDKIGRWVDMDNAYRTTDVNYMESVIWAFKQIYDKKLIYKGKRVSLFSTDTSTPVSNFEVAMDADNYRDVDDLSIFTKFKIKNWKTTDEDDRKILTGPVYMVAWTTTPWTIPSNFALAVNKNFTYCLVKFEGEFLIVAKERLEYTFQTSEENIGANDPGKLVQILEEFKGTELEKIEYESVYDFFTKESKPNDFHVYLSNEVTIEDGTGVLHIAPAFGEVDFNFGKEHSLSDIADIDEAGKMTVGEWKGVYLRQASESVAEDLEKKGNLLRSEIHRHRLPFYRGENPLIYMAQDSYFVDIQKIKERMLELNQDINWIPEHIKEGRFGQTISTSPDWAISRNRYWATIMPIWKSEDGDEIVVGSLEEMAKYCDEINKKEIEGKAMYEFQGKPMDLHRDVADKIVLTKDGKKYHRIPEVLDCWMDSGSVPFAEHHYPFENKEAFEQAFPADYIIEYVGQVRAWFNVLHRISTMIFDNRSFTNVICTGVLAGNDGRKMSKSFGNYPDPKDVLNKIGGEALRLYLMGSPIMVGGDMNWSDELLNEQVKTILIPLWNTYKYLTIYTELHNWNPENTEFNSKNVLDKWLENYLNKVTYDYSQALESYNIPESVRLIQPAIDNISAWWIRRSRDRFVTGDVEAMQTLYAAMVRICKTFAPQMPFVMEEIYQNLVVNTDVKSGKESVHLDDFPEVGKDSFDDKILLDMEYVRANCTAGLKIRDDQKIKLRQPLSVVYVNDDTYGEIIKDELNVKEVKDLNDFYVKHGSPDISTMPVTEEFLGKGVFGVKGQININNKMITYFVAIDTILTPELKNEGLLNEVVRAIQNFRKNSGLKMGENVKLKLHVTDKDFQAMLEENSKKIGEKIISDDIKVELVSELTLPVTINEYQMGLEIVT